MYSFIFFNIEDNKITKCGFLKSNEITSKNYNFDKDEMSLDEFSKFIEPIDNSLELLKLTNKELFNTYNDLTNKEYQMVLIKVGKNRYTRVFKVPNYEIDNIKESINKKETSKIKPVLKKKQILSRKNLFSNKTIVKASLSTILLLSGVVANAKSNKNDNIISSEDAIEVQEDIMNTTDINSLLGPISSLASKIAYKNTISINADDYTNTQKYIDCYNNYYQTIMKYATTYGIDPSLALAIACHERGYHSNEVDPGGGLGLYQIQIEGSWNWDNKEISAFNFDTMQNETYIIQKDKIRSLDDNIKAGLMIFQNCLKRNNYNVAKAVTEYNYGSTYLDKTINDACYYLNKDKNYFDDVDHLEWLDYRNYGGDPNYLENVFKYIEDGKILTFKKENGNDEVLRYQNINNLLNVASTNKKR